MTHAELFSHWPVAAAAPSFRRRSRYTQQSFHVVGTPSRNAAAPLSQPQGYSALAISPCGRINTSRWRKMVFRLRLSPNVCFATEIVFHNHYRPSGKDEQQFSQLRNLHRLALGYERADQLQPCLLPGLLLAGE